MLNIYKYTFKVYSYHSFSEDIVLLNSHSALKASSRISPIQCLTTLNLRDEWTLSSDVNPTVNNVGTRSF